MTRSMQHFGEDDEAASTLRDLGYSEEEIGRTAGDPALSSMQAEDRLRVSLRALSQEHSEETQRRAEHAPGVPQPNAKMFDKQERPTQSEDYERGRRDERYLKKNDPTYKKPQHQPRAPRPVDPTQKAMSTAKKFGSLARKARGRR